MSEALPVVALDTETLLIEPGLAAPPMVCLSTRRNREAPSLYHVNDNALDVFDALLEEELILVGQNIAYDFAVGAEEMRRRRGADAGERFLRRVFKAYDEGRVRDLKVRARLLDIHDGVLRGGGHPYGLEALADRYLGVKISKGEDTWRLRYGELLDVPLNAWPQAARKYPLDDAEITSDVFHAQQSSIDKRSYSEAGAVLAIRNEPEQCKAAWAFHLMSTWGIRTDPERVAKLRTELEQEIYFGLYNLTPAGVYRKDGSQDQKRLRDLITQDYTARGLPPPKTPTGRVSTSKKTLEACQLDVLKRVTSVVHAKKILSTFVTAMEKGVVTPINAGFNVLVESGRSSCSRPNLQNLPRRDGVRRCFVPRAGHVFSTCDYSVLELRTLAQVCTTLGFKSTLREDFVAGRDPHARFAAQLLGISYDAFLGRLKGEDEDARKEAKGMRQLAKAFNFGKPGGLGAVKFADFAAASGVSLTVDRSRHLGEMWLRSTPEMVPYFQWVEQHVDPISGRGRIMQIMSRRIRAGASYTALCNTLFQGLAADGAKDALYHAVRECYLDRSSDLYGSRPVVFVHDEIVAEHPTEHAGPAAQRLAALMVDVMQEWTPDVPQQVEPALMTCWDKEAEPVFDDEGRLIPWDSDDEE